MHVIKQIRYSIAVKTDFVNHSEDLHYFRLKFTDLTL